MIKPISKSAFTLVEMLVVMLIVGIISLYAAPNYMRASRLERNFRTEGYARTQLVLDLEQIERELSLANSIEWIEMDGRKEEAVIRDSRELLKNRKYMVRLGYPLEAGGVAFETNRISFVSNLSFACFPDFISTTVSNRVEMVPTGHRKALSPEGVLFVRDQNVVFTGLSITNIVVGGEVQSNLLHVALSAEVRQETRDHDNPKWKPIEVSRIVRMWNR